MLNLSEIDQAVLLARGEYSTVRAAHEDAKKDLQMLCGSLSSISSSILRAMQPSEDKEPMDVTPMLNLARATVDSIEATTARIESLAKQRAELKGKAWSK